MTFLEEIDAQTIFGGCSSNAQTKQLGIAPDEPDKVK